MSKVITMTVYNRPDYTRRCLEALAKCEGIKQYQVFIHVDPGCDEVSEICAGWVNGGDLLMSFNEKRVGCNMNILSAMAHGFEHSDTVIHIEDDILLAPDALKWFEWALDKYKDDKSVFSVSGYSNKEPSEALFFYQQRRSWFTPWGWATWKDRFEPFANIIRLNEKAQPERSWDWITNYGARGGRYEVFPILSRTKNIGEYGVHTNPIIHKSEQTNTLWAGDPVLMKDVERREFQ